MLEKTGKQINGRDLCRFTRPLFGSRSTAKSDARYEFFLTDCLEKVFYDQKPRALTQSTLYVVPGELPAVQLVYSLLSETGSGFSRPNFHLSVEGAPVPARVRSVQCVPSDYTAGNNVDDNYLTKQPGFLPDLLQPMDSDVIRPIVNQYRALWIDFPGLEVSHAGTYTIQLHITPDEGLEAMGNLIEIPNRESLFHTVTLNLVVLPSQLPVQRTLHTEWIHVDSLCDYYNVPAYSEAHWEQIDHLIEMAVKEHAVNLLLTPVFTLALNTGFGLERTNTQLIDVDIRNGEYTFGFDKLVRWCEICRKHNVPNLEISHLFSQWGAIYSPKVVASTPDGEKNIFGWHVQACEPEYKRFLSALLPQLCDVLKNNGYDNKHVYFHISDEPFAAMGHDQTYLAAKEMLKGLIDDYIIIDALSDYSLYENGICEHPVPTSDHFYEFYEKGFDDPWVYYCVAQANKVPNRFMSMPSARSRIMGVLMYRYNINGFLHWGYNYYNDMYSTQKQNPFFQTSSNHCFPSGDAYLVYPGDHNMPWSSIRAEVIRESFDDIRLLQLLESLIGREAVLSMIQAHMGSISFFEYPTDASVLLSFHEAVCAEIEKHLN